MNSFITPVEGQHLYVIGIDFGHGETSADICGIQWNDTHNKLDAPETLEILHNLKAIKSALLIEESREIEDGQLFRYYIGEEAIERYTSQHRRANTGDIRMSYYAYFKKTPSLMSDLDKEIMTIFMREVYGRIRQRCVQLTDNNHIVYIACPSNPQKWNDEELRLYCQLALNAGIPIAKIDDDSMGIIRESRAAFLKARSHPSSKASIREGILLIDFGSSTVDLTYYSSIHTDKPVDGGGDCGASHFENIIMEDLVKHNPSVNDAVTQIPASKTAILLSIREAKEKYFRYSEEDMEVSLSLTKVTAGAIRGSIDEYYSSESIDALLSDYKSSIKECFSRFEQNVTHGKPIKLIFLTGGASRMGFVQDLAKEVFHYNDKVYIEPDPSLTISNGIALAGRADLRAYALRKKLLSSPGLAEKISPDVLDVTADKVASSAIEIIEKNYKRFAESSSSLSISSLENDLTNSVKYIPCLSFLNDSFTDILRRRVNDLITKDLNNVVGNYFPDESIPQISPNRKFSVSSVSNTSIDTVIGDSVSTITEDFFEGTLKVIGTLVGGVLGLGLAVIVVLVKKIVAFFQGTSDDTDFWDLVDEISGDLMPNWRDKYSSLDKGKREKVYAKFKENKTSYRDTLKSSIKKDLEGKSDLVTSINNGFTNESKGYIVEQIKRFRLMLN